jgi:hypothetical protein
MMRAMQLIQRGARCGVAGVLAWIGAGCATTGSHKGGLDESGSPLSGDTSNVAVAMPRETAAARDNRAAPILQVATVGNVVFPYVYGYPIYPEGDAARGILALRGENANGAKQVDREDAEGVVHAVEDLPQLGCKFEGIRENLNKFVPLSLTCELPAPKGLGGSKKPVLGALMVGAKAEQVLQEPTVKQTFLGAFHLTSDDFASGSGTGYFNTTHGQLALVFSRKKLARFVYYFDPGVKGWQNPVLWVRP